MNRAMDPAAKEALSVYHTLTVLQLLPLLLSHALPKPGLLLECPSLYDPEVQLAALLVLKEVGERRFTHE